MKAPGTYLAASALLLALTAITVAVLGDDEAARMILFQEKLLAIRPHVLHVNDRLGASVLPGQPEYGPDVHSGIEVDEGGDPFLSDFVLDGDLAGLSERLKGHDRSGPIDHRVAGRAAETEGQDEEDYSRMER